LWRQDFSPDGFSWIDASDFGGNVLAFLRFAGSGETGPGAKTVACLVNFSGEPHHNYRIGLPAAGRWREMLNTDAADYGGSGVGNLGAVEAVNEPWHGRPASAVFNLPPLGVLLLAPDSR
jgi:1,4-alpha-glucan branching enzyme